MTEPLFLKLVEDVQTVRRELGDLRRRIEIPTIAGGGSGAPSDASYLVVALDGDLSAERVLVGGGGLTLTDSGAGGNATLAVGAGTLLTVAADSVGLTVGTATGQFIRAGLSPFTAAWSTLTLPNAATTGDLLLATGANAIGNLVDVAAGQPLLSGGVGVIPAYAGWNLAGTAGQTYSFPAAGGTVALGAGTLTVATANDATIASHTHAITSSSNPGANARILATDGSGYLTLTRLYFNATSYFDGATAGRAALVGDLRVSGFAGVGTSPATTVALNVAKTFTDPAGTTQGVNVAATITATANNAQSLYALQFAAYTGAVAFDFTGILYGVQGFAYHMGSGTLGQSIGMKVGSRLQATGNTTTMDGLVLASGFAAASTGNCTTSREILISAPLLSGSGTMGARRGIQADNQGAASVTGDSCVLYAAAQSGAGGVSYVLYSLGGASYHAGVFACGGTVAAAAQVHVDQSSATGAIPVLLLDQADEDQPFTKYVGATAANWTKPISTLQGGGAATGPLRSAGGGGQTGWLFAGMARMDVNGATVWMPYYTEETT